MTVDRDIVLHKLISCNRELELPSRCISIRREDYESPSSRFGMVPRGVILTQSAKIYRVSICSWIRNMSVYGGYKFY